MNNPKRILLVDDDPDMRELISMFLSSSDCEITEAENVAVAMRELSNGKSYDLAILDFWLGKDHAISILDSIRSQAHDFPVIIISGGGRKLDLEKTEAISDASGAIKFLQKPFRKNDLIEAVASAISR